jgi:hypothetical protein
MSTRQRGIWVGVGEEYLSRLYRGAATRARL